MANQAVGFIEAEGFTPIFAAVDAMVKSTAVHVRGVIRLGGGLVAVSLQGDLATVEEAVAVGEATACRLAPGPVSAIVFANPSDPVAGIAATPDMVNLDGV